MQFSIALILFCLSPSLYSHDAVEEYKFFKNGEYDQVIKMMEAMDDEHKNDLKHTILLAKSYFKMEEYRKSLKYYGKIIDKEATKNIPLETFYEYAQINYALDNLKTAKEFFEKSHRLGYNKNLCLYYIGIIHHSKNQMKEAHTYYDQIIESKGEDPEDIEIKQAAYAQKAELRLSIYQKKLDGKDLKMLIDDNGEINDYEIIESSKIRMKKRVLSLFETGIELDPNGSLVPTMKNRILEITNKYDLDTQRMVNGRPIQNTDLTLRLNAIFGYDTNVVSVSDSNPTQPTEKKSYTGELRTFLRKIYAVSGRYFINPELTVNYKYHFDRDVSAIFTNDNATVTPALRISREHVVKGKPASTLLDLEYAYNYRDYNSAEKLQYYNQAYTVSIGEKASVFGSDESTLRLKYKDNSSYNANFDSSTITTQFSHFFNFESGNRFIFVTNLNITDSETDSLDTDSLSLIGNYIWFPEDKEYVTFYTFGLNLTGTQYKDDATDASRGTEVLVSPSLTTTKIIDTNSKLSFKYAYTYNSSKDKTTFTYDKHVLTLDYAYSF